MSTVARWKLGPDLCGRIGDRGRSDPGSCPLSALPTVFAAVWTARGTEAVTATPHGLLIGRLFFDLLGPPAPAAGTLTVVVGPLGGLGELRFRWRTSIGLPGKVKGE